MKYVPVKIVFYGLLFISSILVAHYASATTRTWVGGSTGSWSTPGNWSPSGVPVPGANPSIGDDIIFDGNNAATVTITDLPALLANTLFGQFTATNNVTLNISGTGNCYFRFGTGISIDAGSTVNLGAATTGILSFGSNSTTAGATTINGTLELKGTGTDQVNNRKEFYCTGGANVAKVYGRLIFSGPAAVLYSGASGLYIKAGGELQWAREGVVMPAFTFEDGGIVNITGIVATTLRLSNFGNYFGLVKWNCPAQTATNIELVPSVGPLVFHLDSVLVSNTGTGSLCMGLQPSYSIGQLEIAGGTVTLGKATAAQTSATIVTDLKITGGTVIGNATFTGDVVSYPLTLSIGQDLIMTGGSFDLTNRPTANSPGGAGLVNITRNFIKTGGTISATSAFGSQNTLNMMGTAAQNIQVNSFGSGTYALVAYNTSTTQGIKLLDDLTLPANVPLVMQKGAFWLNSFTLSVPRSNLFLVPGTPMPRVYTNGYGKLKLTGVPASATVVFPVTAFAYNSYEPLTVTTTAAAGTHDYQVRVQYGNDPGGIYSPLKTIKRTWVVNAIPAAPSAQVGLTYQYADSAKGNSCTASAIMEEGHFAGSAWNVDPLVQLTPTGSDPYTVGPFYPGGLDSSFVIGNQASILAFSNTVHLRLQQNSNSILLQWATGNNTGYNYYVERSVNGRDFMALATAGYQLNYTDAYTTGIVYYRVKAIGMDGSILYSNIVKAGYGQAAAITTYLYPTLVKNTATLFISGAVAGKTVLSVTGTSGQVWLKKDIAFVAGENNIVVDLSALPAGVYQLGYTVNGVRQVLRFIKE